MKQMITAGKHVDMLTADELNNALRSHAQNWWREAHIGTRWHRIGIQGSVVSSALSMGGERGEKVGPEDGFVWDIRRLHIVGITTLSDLPKVAIGINDKGDAAQVGTWGDQGATGTLVFTTQFVLQQGETLKVYSTANLTQSSGTVTVTAQVRELPIHQLWRLGGGA